MEEPMLVEGAEAEEEQAQDQDGEEEQEQEPAQAQERAQPHAQAQENAKRRAAEAQRVDREAAVACMEKLRQSSQLLQGLERKCVPSDPASSQEQPVVVDILGLVQPLLERNEELLRRLVEKAPSGNSDSDSALLAQAVRVDELEGNLAEALRLYQELNRCTAMPQPKGAAKSAEGSAGPGRKQHDR